MSNDNYQQKKQPKTNAGEHWGIAGFVFGNIALLTSLIPCFGAYALIPCSIATILILIGLNKANKNNGKKSIFRIGFGLVIFSSIIAIIWLIFILQDPEFFAN